MSAPPRSADRRPGRGSWALALAVLFLSGGAAVADPPLRLSEQVRALERGLFCAMTEGGRLDAPDTEFGWIHVPDEPVTMRRRGAVVPAVLGLGFGVEYMMTGDDPVLIRHVVEHPPMPPSDRVRQTWESWVLGGVPEIVFFQFDIDEELLTGRWSFTLFDGKDEVFHAAFDIVDAGKAPHLAGLCAAGDLLTLNR